MHYSVRKKMSVFSGNVTVMQVLRKAVLEPQNQTVERQILNDSKDWQ